MVFLWGHISALHNPLTFLHLLKLFMLIHPKSRSKGIFECWLRVTVCSAALQLLILPFTADEPPSTVVSSLCLQDLAVSVVKINSFLLPSSWGWANSFLQQICSLNWQGLAAFQSPGHFISTPLPFSSIIVRNKTFLIPDWSLTNSISHLPHANNSFLSLSLLAPLQFLKDVLFSHQQMIFHLTYQIKISYRSPLTNFIRFFFFEFN